MWRAEQGCPHELSDVSCFGQLRIVLPRRITEGPKNRNPDKNEEGVFGKDEQIRSGQKGQNGQLLLPDRRICIYGVGSRLLFKSSRTMN